MLGAGYSSIMNASPKYRDLWLEGGGGAPQRGTCPSPGYLTFAAPCTGCCNWCLQFFAQRIDHIFLCPGANFKMRCCRMRVICQSEDSIKASDHCAMLAVLE